MIQSHLAELLAIIFAASATTLLIVHGSIFAPLRILKLFRCPLCLGWWAGIVAYLIFPSDIYFRATWEYLAYGLSVGAVTSVFSYTIHRGFLLGD